MPKKLTPLQERVLYGKETEPPGTGTLLHNKDTGQYRCAACGNVLFTSKTKFDSGSGWPSFTDTEKDAVTLKPDNSLGTERTEVICNKCKSHLGHVFDDGPKPTGKRYCINSAALEFEKA